MSDPSEPTNPMTVMTTTWTRLVENTLRSATEANRAAIDAFTGPNGGRAADTRGDRARSYACESSVPSVQYELPGWSFERSVDQFDDITVGDTVRFSKTIDDEDVRTFAAVSGDTNRLHLDDEFAEKTRFGERIVHGTLVSALISSALARLPGTTIYLSQDLEFHAPVHIGDQVTATVEVVENLGKGQYRLTTTVHDDTEDELLIDGEATVLIEDLPHNHS